MTANEISRMTGLEEFITKGINKITVQKLGLPNKWDDDNDKYHAMINVLSNMESFFPCVELNTDSWDNIHAVICHATHAYTRINEEKKPTLTCIVWNKMFFFPNT